MTLRPARYATCLEMRPSVKLICEDRTIIKEYFEEIQKKFQNIFTIETIPAGTKTNAKRVASIAVRIKNEVNRRNVAKDFHVCCIFDVDKNSCKELLEAIKICETNQISCYISNPCMEIWYLNHYDSWSMKEFENAKDVIKTLLKHFPDYNKKQKKSLKKTKSIKYLIKSIETACNNSKKQIAAHEKNKKYHIKDQNPATQNHRLIEKFYIIRDTETLRQG